MAPTFAIAGMWLPRDPRKHPRPHLSEERARDPAAMASSPPPPLHAALSPTHAEVHCYAVLHGMVKYCRSAAAAKGMLVSSSLSVHLQYDYTITSRNERRFCCASSASASRPPVRTGRAITIACAEALTPFRPNRQTGQLRLVR
eukprot:5903312-Pleurochrysis_carterae.AAC.2